MLKFFFVYLVVVFFIGMFNTWRALRRMKSRLREAQANAQYQYAREHSPKRHQNENVVEAEYKVIDK